MPWTLSEKSRKRVRKFCQHAKGLAKDVLHTTTDGKVMKVKHKAKGKLT